MKCNICKEDFIKVINSIVDNDSDIDKLAELGYCDYNLNASLIMMSLNIVTMLDNAFCTDVISFWCNNLQFGKTYDEEYVKKDYGPSVDISTVEKLWDYLEKECGRKIQLSNN